MRNLKALGFACLLALAVLFATPTATTAAVASDPGPCSPTEWAVVYDAYVQFPTSTHAERVAAWDALIYTILPAQEYNCSGEYGMSWAGQSANYISSYCQETWGDWMFRDFPMEQCAANARHLWTLFFLLSHF